MASVEPQRLNIKVFSPYQTFFSGSGISLSAQNKVGPFDVLYDHSNFFSLLVAGRVEVNTGFEKIEIEVESGFIKVTDNNVVLFANV